MKWFSIQSRYVIIFFLAIALIQNFSVKAEIPADQKDAKTFQLIESLVGYSQELGGKITDNIHNLIDFIEDIFHISHNYNDPINSDQCI